MLITSGQTCKMSNQKEDLKGHMSCEERKIFSSPDYDYQKKVARRLWGSKKPTLSVLNDCCFQCYVDHYKHDSCINLVTHMPLSSQQICTLSMDVHDG